MASQKFGSLILFVPGMKVAIIETLSSLQKEVLIPHCELLETSI